MFYKPEKLNVFDWLYEIKLVHKVWVRLKVYSIVINLVKCYLKVTIKNEFLSFNRFSKLQIFQNIILGISIILFELYKCRFNFKSHT